MKFFVLLKAYESSLLNRLNAISKAEDDPEYLKLFTDWKSTLGRKTKNSEEDAKRQRTLKQLLDLVGSLTQGTEEELTRLKRFIREKDLLSEDKKALSQIAETMEEDIKGRESKRIEEQHSTPETRQSKLLGMQLGKRTSKSPKLNNYRVPEKLTGKRRFNVPRSINMSLDRDWNHPELNELREAAQRIGASDFKAFFEGWSDTVLGRSSDKDLTVLESLIDFANVVLPQLIEKIKSGIVPDPETKQPVYNLQNQYKNALRQIQSNRKGVIEELFRIARGVRPSKKTEGPMKKELQDVEDSILKMLNEEIYGHPVLFYILDTHLKVHRKTRDKSILVTMLREEKEKAKDAWREKGQKPAPPKEKYKPIPRGIPWNPSREEFKRSQEEVGQTLDSLLKHLNVQEDNCIIKEDVGLILESLNKKQKKKVKTILNAADPTEYFGQDFLKLGEIIKTLKVLGVVKGDKKLNKKVLRYEDENLKVVKLATRLRKDYEKLYSNLRELVYPKAV